MDLDCDDSFLGDCGVFFGVIDCLDSVEPKFNVWALGANPVVVPFSKGFDGFLENWLLRFCKDFVSSALVVESSIESSSQVSLVA